MLEILFLFTTSFCRRLKPFKFASDDNLFSLKFRDTRDFIAENCVGSDSIWFLWATSSCRHFINCTLSGNVFSELSLISRICNSCWTFPKIFPRDVNRFLDKINLITLDPFKKYSYQQLKFVEFKSHVSIFYSVRCALIVFRISTCVAAFFALSLKRFRSVAISPPFRLRFFDFTFSSNGCCVHWLGVFRFLVYVFIWFWLVLMCLILRKLRETQKTNRPTDDILLCDLAGGILLFEPALKKY